jgi:hypothetical protein
MTGPVMADRPTGSVPTPAPVPTPTPKLTASEALKVATQTVSSFQATIQQADAKAAMLLVVHPGTTLLVLTQFGQLPAGMRTFSAASVLAAVGALAFAASFVVSGRHIYGAIRPRTDPPHPGNRFAFPAIAAGCPTLLDATVEELAREAWALTVVLAEIAVHKNRHLHMAIQWLMPMVSGAGLFVCGLRIA